MMNDYSLNKKQRKFLEMVLKTSFMEKLDLVDYRDGFNEQEHIDKGNCWSMKFLKKSIISTLKKGTYSSHAREKFMATVVYFKNKKEIDLINSK